MDQNRHSEANSGSLPPHSRPPQSLPGWFPFSTFPPHMPGTEGSSHSSTVLLPPHSRTTQPASLLGSRNSQSGLKPPNFLSHLLSLSLSPLFFSAFVCNLQGRPSHALGLYILRPIACVLHEAFPQHLCSQESLTAEFLQPQPNSCLQPLPYVCACVGAGCMRAGTSHCPPATAPPCTRCPTDAHSLA